MFHSVTPKTLDHSVISDDMSLEEPDFFGELMGEPEEITATSKYLFDPKNQKKVKDFFISQILSTKVEAKKSDSRVFKPALLHGNTLMIESHETKLEDFFETVDPLLLGCKDSIGQQWVLKFKTNSDLKR